tara:strand:- start:261 stop:392 length:132 start_codon:yes stop_codon:yes gene_type:complete
VKKSNKKVKKSKKKWKKEEKNVKNVIFEKRRNYREVYFYFLST